MSCSCQTNSFALSYLSADTVDQFLADLDRRYGAIDAALVWPTYPNLGADDRNQFDMWRALPGGLDAVKHFTTELKARGC